MDVSRAEHEELARDDQKGLHPLSRVAFEQSLNIMQLRSGVTMPLTTGERATCYQMILDYLSTLEKDADTYRIQPYVDSRGGHRWRMLASNGRIVADGSEAYASKANNVRAALSITGAQFIVMPYVEEPK